jgi:hypothetical protein
VLLHVHATKTAALLHVHAARTAALLHVHAAGAAWSTALVLGGRSTYTFNRF